MNSDTAISRSPRGLRFTRLLPVPQEVVFRALSDAEQLRAWWGPPDYPMVECSLDFRPGGVWHYCLRGTRTGREVWARSVYREIDPPRRVSYFETSSDVDGRITDVRPAADVTVELNPEGPHTMLTVDVRYSSLLGRDSAIRMGIERGLSAALDLLTDLLRADVPAAPHRKEHHHADRDVR